ncbi:MAG: hypothetical protein K2K19_02545 [Acetatifactor sp.]|nr:hypothetical protein [Acetatifactor sp.]
MRLFVTMFGLQLMLTTAVIKMLSRLDAEHGLRADREAGCILLAGCLAGAGYIACAHDREPPIIWIIYLVLAVYLTVCVITDRQTCKVYDCLQLPAAVFGAALCLLRPVPVSGGTALIGFALLQYFLFMRLYGRGDGMAFQICSLYVIGAGGGPQTLLLHMAASFALLGIVQLMRGNINRKGNLKIPVPFLPYIAFSLLCFL